MECFYKEGLFTTEFKAELQGRGGPIQILYHKSALRYTYHVEFWYRNTTSVALNSNWYNLASMLQCDVFLKPFHAKTLNCGEFKCYTFLDSYDYPGS